MIDRRLRATVLLTEAAALGLQLEDLIAADTTPPAPAPTLAEHIAATAPHFSAGTAATYGTYWRLAIEHLGNRRLTDITIVDLQLVVTDTARRAQQRRSSSTGRSSQETCVAALRALFNRAHAAGLIAANPAAARTKPRRSRSSRRALDDHELTELIDAIRTGAPPSGSGRRTTATASDPSPPPSPASPSVSTSREAGRAADLLS